MSYRYPLTAQSLAAFSLLTSVCVYSVSAQEVAHPEQVKKEATKNDNITQAQKINGTGREPLGGPSVQTEEKNKMDAKKTASVVNQVPGVKVAPADLEPPSAPPIKGFHPIKKLLRPVENLEGMSIKLEQQVMKLEGPIAGLQPPMIGLQKKMTKVDSSIGNMQGQLSGMQNQVTGVRSDLSTMRKDIEALKKPIQHLEGPIGAVSKPLEQLEIRLNYILLAILIATLGIAVGTPVAAVVLYKNRHKLGVHDRDLPKAARADTRSQPV